MRENSWHGRIDIPYSSLEHVIVSSGNGIQPMLTLTLKISPEIYEILSTHDLHHYAGKHQRASASMSNNEHSKRLKRLCALNSEHDRTSALCRVYQVVFPNQGAATQALHLIQTNPALPKKNLHIYKTHVPTMTGKSGTIEVEFQAFCKNIAPLMGFGFAFDIRFQAFALVLNGAVPPMKMAQLIPAIRKLLDQTEHSTQHISKAVAMGIGRLRFNTPTPQDNGTDDIGTIERRLHNEVKIALRELEAVYPSHQSVLTYKAMVTPTSLLLSGPELVASNRVLRRHSKHTGHFMRVVFADEDGRPVSWKARANQDEIYNRFRKVLQEGIQVAERIYQFLGFSHSSLHEHTAWFMALFREGDSGDIVTARDVIKKLGDFSHIHCAAKCAARIGQAFSDTIFAIHLPETVIVTEMEDVERGSHVFSDGCGTISLALLERVWATMTRVYQNQKPVVLQIRYRGAKGVVSLDPGLEGEQLHIRKSMKKYVAEASWNDLEICGAGHKPLPMCLNHQYIKILEDLGVPHKNFLSILEEAKQELKMVVQDPVNAANFLGMCS